MGMEKGQIVMPGHVRERKWLVSELIFDGGIREGRFVEARCEEAF